jgi:hypothetical protein
MRISNYLLNTLPLILASFCLLLLQGCLVTQTQLTRIENGEKPAIAIITSVQEKVNICHIGFTVFSNRDYSYPSPTNTHRSIEQLANILLENSNRIQLIQPPTDVVDSILEVIPKEPNRNWNGNLTESDISRIAALGKKNRLDYVALIFSNVTDNPTYGRPGSPTGKGILSDYVITYLYASYKIVLIDTSTMEVTDTSGISTFKHVPRFSRKLSKADIDRITKDWHYEKDNSETSLQPQQTLEQMLTQASLFDADDFSSLKEEYIEKIDQELTAVLKRNMLMNLINIGFIKGEKSYTRFDRIEAEEDTTNITYQLDE